MTNPIIRFYESVCVQTAVYWGAPQPDGYGGYSYDSPVEISVRWDEKNERITDNEGIEIVSRAQVMVIQDVDEGGYLCLCSLSDIDSSDLSNPEDISDAYVIKRVDKSPLFRSTNEFVRMAYL